ncbi:TlpA family protein disulfide reductase [Shewanella gelidimarina]|uniref:TlpA disulfide reductase family protein n=1 Tax=Shewanella gelidimarina TaxID=56813 RepID=UPI00200C2C76|nr:TlpA disulfide reductase family protein [Shewanella gelidimarina]MCL1057591.1 TlpA family protein disulfide reductase [Shewanella gelidimarina]
MHLITKNVAQRFSQLANISLLLVSMVLAGFVLSAAVQAEEVKPMATDFSLKDASGQLHSLADYKGKPLILHFWATWCPYCKKLQPGLEKIRHDNQQSDLQVLAISFNEDDGANPAETLLARGIQFPTLVNGDKVAADYGVSGTPTTFFINRFGEVVWKTNISDPNDRKLVDATEYILAN